MIQIDVLRLILSPDSLSILLYYFIPGYLFFAFIRFKEFFGLRDKWKVITGLDMIIFSIILSIVFSLNFLLIFYAFIDWYLGFISVLGILCVQLPIHYFEKYKTYKLEYLYLGLLSVVVTFYSEMLTAAASASYAKLLSPTIGIIFFLLIFKILRFKLLVTLKPEAANEIGFW